MLSAFAMIRQNTYEPLLKDLTRYVMGDEARHVAYGVLSLRDYYADQQEKVVAEREDFVHEAAVLMRERFPMQEMWQKRGLPYERCLELAMSNQGQIFRQLLFAKIVPAIKKIGLVSPRQRERFQGLGIMQYENAEDPIVALERSEAERTAAAAS